MMVKTLGKTKKVKLTPEQKALEKAKKKAKLKEKQEKAKLRKIERDYFQSIENIFINSGFISMPVEGKQFDIGSRPRCELDHCFVSQNIIIICEQTTGEKSSDHLLKKQETSNEITRSSENKKHFIDYLSSNFPDKIDTSSFNISRWKIFYLYFSRLKIDYTPEDFARYDKLRFIDNPTYMYLTNMSKVIKKSFLYEILRFLNIETPDYGSISAGGGIPLPTRDVSIIYPNDVTGMNDGVGIVSFMMSPNELIKSSYVLRKDNWQEKIGLYQRLITEPRIKNIRKFILSTKRTFFNNIIVGLPSDIVIYDEEDKPITIESLDRYQNCKMRLSEGFNTMSIIDGQHRVYAYYENNILDEEEKEVQKLRSKLNLLVTGIVFPPEWTEFQKRSFQSDIFLQINRNAKNVSKDVLLHIESTKEPFSSFSIARNILEKMNKLEPFKEMFELSLVEKSRIKVASIIQFALGFLVNPKYEANGLYKSWIISKNYDVKRKITDEAGLSEYTKYCASSLCMYFNAIKSTYRQFWDDNKSHILKVISINGFIIAFHDSLRITDTVMDFDYYKTIYQDTRIDFSKGIFPYSGSKYSQFAKEMINPSFVTHSIIRYLSIIGIKKDQVIYFLNDHNISAIYKEDDKFIFNDSEIGLIELTKICNPKFDSSKMIAGELWLIEDQTLEFIYQKNKAE